MSLLVKDGGDEDADVDLASLISELAKQRRGPFCEEKPGRVRADLEAERRPEPCRVGEIKFGNWLRGIDRLRLIESLPQPAESRRGSSRRSPAPSKGRRVCRYAYAAQGARGPLPVPRCRGASSPDVRRVLPRCARRRRAAARGLPLRRSARTRGTPTHSSDVAALNIVTISSARAASRASFSRVATNSATRSSGGSCRSGSRHTSTSVMKA